MSVQPQIRRRYHLTVQGETLTLEGPPDIVNMYRTVRQTYPPALSVELATFDDDSRLRRTDGVKGRTKVHSNHGDY